MQPKNITPIHCVGFFYHAFGHVTDGEITEEEVNEIITQLKVWCPEEVCPDYQGLVNEIFDWYAGIYDLGQEEMQKTIGFCANAIKNFFEKQSDNISEGLKRDFINALVKIAKADGVVKDSEKAWLKNMSNIMGVENPDI